MLLWGSVEHGERLYRTQMVGIRSQKTGVTSWTAVEEGPGSYILRINFNTGQKEPFAKAES